MNRLINKYNGKSIEDDFSVKSREFKQFAKDFKKELRQLDDLKLESFSVGHYDVSGFLSQNNEYVYFSYSVPRGNEPMDMSRSDAWAGILYRTAKDTKDYHGGINNFTNFFNFEKDVKNLFGRCV